MSFKYLVACLMLVGMGSPQMSAAPLSAPGRTIAVREDHSDQPTPVWSRGYVFYRGAEDGSMTVYGAADDPAKIIYQTKIWPDGASTVRFYSPAASPSGEFAVGGTAFNGGGAGTGFIAFFGPGRTQRLVQLPNTGTAALAFADDGTLWVVVRQIDSSLHELSVYDVVRHYSAEGKLLGSAIPRSDFPDQQKGLIYSAASISVSPDMIGIYLDRAGIWAELSYDGSVKGYWQIPKTQANEGWRLLHEQVVMMGSKEVIRVSTMRGKQPKDSITRVERLNKSGASFVPALVDSSAFPSGSPYFPYLIGADGNQLVWMSHNDKIQWTALAE